MSVALRHLLDTSVCGAALKLPDGAKLSASKRLLLGFGGPGAVVSLSHAVRLSERLKWWGCPRVPGTRC